MNDKRRTLVVAPYFVPAVRAGGPVRTLAALIPTAPDWVDVDVVTRNTDHGAPLPVKVADGEWVPRDRHRVLYLGGGSARPARVVVRGDYDLVYLNSFFDVSYSLLPQLALALRARSRAVLVAPRGELSPGALATRKPRKRALIAAYRALGLHRRVLWHASTEREADEIRAVLGTAIRVIVRENETMLPATPRAPAPTPDRELHAVFLSRLVPKKGLHVLLEALARVTGRLVLDVHGVEEDTGYVSWCRELAAASGVEVRFRGAVDPDQVRSVLAAADVMFLPTESENFGHVIAEALSVSCPVVLPDTTPWTGLVRRRGGTVVGAHDAVGWARAVDEWAGLTPAERDRRRLAAGEAYAEWRARGGAPHVLASAYALAGRA